MLLTRKLFSLLMLYRSITPSISSSSTLISESSNRLPMGLSAVISDLEADGVARVTTACLVTSRGVTKSKRASLLESLFGFDDTDVSNTAFGKKIFDDDDDGIVVAHPGSQAPAAEVASTVVACGGTVVYVPSPYDLARGEGLFDTLAPAMEKLMASDDKTSRKAVLVVVADNVATAKSQLEQAASTVLSTLVQPGSSTGTTRKALVLEDVFDTVEYVSSSIDKEHFEDTLCHLAKMMRFFDEDRFEIYATRDIEKDEELTHTYISLTWRTCFSDLNKIVNGENGKK